jgi:hypothetical protein
VQGFCHVAGGYRATVHRVENESESISKLLRTSAGFHENTRRLADVVVDSVKKPNDVSSVALEALTGAPWASSNEQRDDHASNDARAHEVKRADEE